MKAILTRIDEIYINKQDETAKIVIEIPIEDYATAIKELLGKDMILMPYVVKNNESYGLVDIDETKEPKRKVRRAGKITTSHEAWLMLNSENFKYYLFAKHKLTDDQLNSAYSRDDWLKRYLGIKSKRELDYHDNYVVLKKYQELVKDFRRFINT